MVNAQDLIVRFTGTVVHERQSIEILELSRLRFFLSGQGREKCVGPNVSAYDWSTRCMLMKGHVCGETPQLRTHFETTRPPRRVRRINITWTTQHPHCKNLLSSLGFRSWIRVNTNTTVADSTLGYRIPTHFVATDVGKPARPSGDRKPVSGTVASISATPHVSQSCRKCHREE